MKKVYSLLLITKEESKLSIDVLNSEFKKKRAIINNICQRCSNYCIDYCDNCSELYKLTSSTYLYYKKREVFTNDFQKMNIPPNLTPLQNQCGKFIINNNSSCLVWAVCGAGKTEITFLKIEEQLRLKKIVCFAITRSDILYEIYERLKIYFDVDIAIINSQENKIVDANIYVMTTNQILRFKNAFDFVIVDEVDAFPYEYNFKFDFGVHDSLSKTGSVCYLTSTPSKQLLQKRMPTFIINRRWHGHLLPVPILIYCSMSRFDDDKIPWKLLIKLMFSKRQQLIFVSNIDKLEKYKNTLNLFFKNQVLCVHSKLKSRRENITKFKNKNVNILLTTTILERGVTFDDIDVHVLDTDSKLYTTSALVQIAGRVNRKKEFQKGKVFFYHTSFTQEMKNSISQIKKMNS